MSAVKLLEKKSYGLNLWLSQHQSPIDAQKDKQNKAEAMARARRRIGNKSEEEMKANLLDVLIKHSTNEALNDE